jgi:spermidine dehydrogenase
MPIGDNARKEMLDLIEARGDRLKGVAPEEQERYLNSISYRDFLERHMGVTDPEVFRILQGLTTDTTASIEGSSAMSILGYVGLPGLNATGLADYYGDDEPYIHHFPDGNASVARMLVRDLIPGVAAGSSMDDVVLAKFNYDKLDTNGASIRLRLNSTVVRVEHDDPANKASAVSATYVSGNKAVRVKGRACIMAGYNAMIPHICPELPAAQSDALGQAIKAPILYTNVLLNNWRAWEKLGVGFISSPGGYYAASVLDFPVSMGGYSFSRNPDEPIIVHMERFAVGKDPHATKREQRIAGRRELYGTSFEDIERETRGLLAGALAGGGFDPAKDIAAITANRWGHGYAYWPSPLFDYVDGEALHVHVTGRQKFGRITIANSDAGASATVDTAIDQAHRAVSEIQG